MTPAAKKLLCLALVSVAVLTPAASAPVDDAATEPGEQRRF